MRLPHKSCTCQTLTNNHEAATQKGGNLKFNVFRVERIKRKINCVKNTFAPFRFRGPPMLVFSCVSTRLNQLGHHAGHQEVSRCRTRSKGSFALGDDDDDKK